MSMEQGKAQYETVLTPLPGDELLEDLITALRSGHTFSEAEVIQIGLDISDELMLRHKDVVGLDALVDILKDKFKNYLCGVTK